MKFQLKQLLFVIAIFLSTCAKSQIQVDYINFNGFSAVGFGAFLNFSFPVSDANYLTAEAGLDVFSHDGSNVALAPVLLGYRYTLDGSGTGFYLEPNAGYSFAGTDIQVPDANGYYADQKINGPATGFTFGYLFEPSGKIQFNLGLRYEHIFGDAGSNMFSFRISHAFIFGRRD